MRQQESGYVAPPPSHLHRHHTARNRGKPSTGWPHTLSLNNKAPSSVSSVHASTPGAEFESRLGHYPNVIPLSYPVSCQPTVYFPIKAKRPEYIYRKQ